MVTARLLVTGMEAGAVSLTLRPKGAFTDTLLTKHAVSGTGTHIARAAERVPYCALVAKPNRHGGNVTGFVCGGMA